MSFPDLTVGDWESAYLDIAPYDGGTAATLTIHSPADTTPDGVPVAVDAGITLVNDEGVAVKRFTAAAVQYPAAGWWVRGWKVTGVGAFEPDERFYVAPNPVAGGPTWTPTRQNVAAYVPSRPLVPATDGSGRNVDLLTFDASTRPTGGQVDQLIVAAVNWVLAATGDLDATLFETATDCAALRAAGFVELGYPERQNAEKATANTTSDRLLKQAESSLQQLVTRNKAKTGADGSDSTPVVGPAYSFPDASPWGDQLL